MKTQELIDTLTGLRLRIGKTVLEPETVFHTEDGSFDEFDARVEDVGEQKRLVVHLGKELETVDVIASGYEWVCPGCNELVKQIEYKQELECPFCGKEFKAGLPEHAMG